MAACANGSSGPGPGATMFPLLRRTLPPLQDALVDNGAIACVRKDQEQSGAAVLEKIDGVGNANVAAKQPGAEVDAALRQERGDDNDARKHIDAQLLVVHIPSRGFG